MNNRPKIMNERITIRLSSKEVEKLDKLRKKFNCSYGDFLRAVINYLESTENKKGA